jgi:branched-chain amino acid transport system substrate-binding protein
MIVVVIFLLVGGFFYLNQEKTVKVGFVGELSSTSSQLSIESRDAFLYAVDKWNEKGGINGKKIVPYVYDDHKDNQYKEELNRLLKADGVQLIVGFNISGMMETIEYLMLNGDYLIISPTVSTDFMTGKDDQFIKISPINKLQADVLYEVVEQENLKRILIVYSEPNKLYAEAVVGRMTELLKNGGREVVDVIKVTETLNVEAIQQKVAATKPDAMFTILNGADTAKVAQRVRINGFAGPILTTAWAATGDLLSEAGKYGEGIYTVQMPTEETTDQTLTEFEQFVKKNYDSELNFSYMRTYYAADMLFSTIETGKDKSPKALKEAIVKKGTYKILGTTFNIDPYGDTIGTYQLEQIQNGKFVKVR